ncbi:hypothetical protein [Algoriphagus sp. Y33]|uniref:hypothetical protein n=1 Tax=Algoriphagus sp. Y33 TaxID=2772483 RepID=UPI00178393CA|nr:hypothetical protein [Algoriphagus sp. Y33]
MDLAKKYVKSISRKFQKLPIYYPGTKVEVGDIISFGKNIGGGPKKPFGENVGIFGNVVKDTEFGNQIEVEYGALDRFYQFVSENEVSVQAGGTAELPDLAKGEFKFSFNKEGAIVIIASGVELVRMSNLSQLKRVINEATELLNWREYYIVSGVEIAGTAIVYQSQSKSGELVLKANTENIELFGEDIAGIDAGMDIQIKWSTDNSFVIPDAKNMTLFMKLIRVKSNGALVGFNKAKGLGGVDGGELELEEFNIEDL